MLGSRSLLPPPKRRHHGRRFRKWAAELNSATAAAVPDSPGSLSAGPAGFLSAGLASFLFPGLTSSEPASAASAPGGNLVRNRVEFCNLG